MAKSKNPVFNLKVGFKLRKSETGFLFYKHGVL